LDQIFTRIEHSRTADEVVQRMEALILEGVLSAGDRLPGERDLSAQFDVSRPILRDALKTLEARGLVETRHGGGTHVADIVGEVFAPPMAELIRSHRKAAADYLEYRREVEAIAADYAARRATEDDRAMLAAIMVRMEAAHAAADFEAEAAADVDFHNAVGECAHNIVLLHTLRSCYRLLAHDVFYNRSLIYTLPGVRDRLLEQHQAIWRAVAGGDAQGAREAATRHIDFVEQAATEAERASDWQRVSRLRLHQRAANLDRKAKTNAG
jgi:GntR family transcriptional regulator, transcriptional repressor for pyruvate dehydrogenase complex